MITISILIALSVNGLIINPVYQWLLFKLHINKKPLNCVYCLAWWIGVIYVLGTLNGTCVAVPFAASFLAVIINRWFEKQPIRIN